MRHIFRVAISTFLIFHFINAHQNCTNVGLKTDKSTDGSTRKFCEYVESAGAKPLQLLEGSTFVTTACQTCKCSATGLQCCEKPKPPVNVPAGCKVIIDGCKYLTVSAVDYNKDCFTGLQVSKKIEKTAGPIKRTMTSPEGGAAIASLLNKLIGLISRPRFGMFQNQRFNPLQSYNPEYEPSPADIFRFMIGESQNPMLGQFTPPGLNGLSSGLGMAGLGVFGLPAFAETAGLSMFMGGSDPVEQMIMKDIMTAEKAKIGKSIPADLLKSGINNMGDILSSKTGFNSSPSLMDFISSGGIGQTGNAGGSGLIENIIMQEKMAAEAAKTGKKNPSAPLKAGPESVREVLSVKPGPNGSSGLKNTISSPTGTNKNAVKTDSTSAGTGSSGQAGLLDVTGGARSSVETLLLDMAFGGAGITQNTGYMDSISGNGLDIASSLDPSLDLTMGGVGSAGSSGSMDLTPGGAGAIGNAGWMDLIHVYSPPSGGAGISQTAFYYT